MRQKVQQQRYILAYETKDTTVRYNVKKKGKKERKKERKKDKINVF
jgi:hypothetical protein